MDELNKTIWRELLTNFGEPMPEELVCPVPHIQEKLFEFGRANNLHGLGGYQDFKGLITMMAYRDAALWPDALHVMAAGSIAAMWYGDGADVWLEAWLEQHEVVISIEPTEGTGRVVYSGKLSASSEVVLSASRCVRGLLGKEDGKGG